MLLLSIVFFSFWSMVAREAFSQGAVVVVPLVRHLNLLLAFVGATLAARENKLLRLATGELRDRWKGGRWIAFATTLVSCAVTGLLARSCVELVQLEREFGTTVGGESVGIPLWPLLLVMPFSAAGIGLRLAWKLELHRALKVVALAAFAGGAAVGSVELLEGVPAWPTIVVLLVATLLGAPLYVPLAGSAILLFLEGGIPAVAVSAEMYRLASSPFLPTIPIFTLIGFLLTEGDAPRRLLDVFRTCFGWLPGGTAVICALVCAFFSIFTGGSGVTILALGGLLFHALQSDGYRESFSLGLLTASGSLGILLPPALPLILFGIAAEVPIEELFLGGILPGLLLIGLIALWGMRAGWIAGVARTPFEPRAAARALWRGKFELLIPGVTLGAFLSGYATLLEASALTAVYTLIVQLLIHREVPVRDLGRILTQCSALLGGVLIILCAAFGLTNYLVDAQIPGRLLEWIQAGIDSPWMFLLCLNLFLLAVGCFLDIFSATFVIVPLLLPLGAAYDIDPVHLGIIFVANLELGYLTPPIGLNLFLASYRFERPLLAVYRGAWPMLLILGAGVLLITYVPALTMLFLDR